MTGSISPRTGRLSAAGLARRIDRRDTPGRAVRPEGANKIPAYRHLAQQIRDAASEGRLTAGTALPSERELATALELSRTTVAAAYALLREAGWLRSRQGAPSVLTIPGVPEGMRSAFGSYWTEEGAASPHLIDLGIASLPATTELADAATDAVTLDLPAHLSSDGYHPHGLPMLRARIADRYSAEGVPTTPDQILITSGAQHALFLLLNELSAPGERVLLECPTYPRALDLVRAAHRLPVTLALDPAADHPWDLGLLAAILRSSAPRLGYLIPDAQNPTGVTMDDADRAELVHLVAAAGCTVVVDESFRTLFGDDGDGDAAGRQQIGMPPSLAAYGDPGTVIAVGSMSKPFWGGLRIGWIRAAAAVIDRLAAGRALYDMAGPVIDQLIALRLWEDPRSVVREQRRRLEQTRSATRAAMRELLPHWEIHGAENGIGWWIRLPGPYATELCRLATSVGVRLIPGTRFGPDGTMENHIRLPLTQPADQLVDAIGRLAEIDATAARGRGGTPLVSERIG